MENNYSQNNQDQNSNLFGGIIGAIGGSAIGAVVWALVGMLGYISSIVGFLIAFLADKGYDLLKGRQGAIKMVVLIICVVLAVVAGTVGTYVWLLHNTYNEEMAAYPASFKASYPESEFIMECLADSEVQGGMLKDGALGMLFGIMGSIGLIINAKNNKKKEAPPTQQPTTPNDFSDSSNSTDSFNF